MPRYEYKCPGCGVHFEMRRTIAEMDAPAGCAVCGYGRVERLLNRSFSISVDHAIETAPPSRRRSRLHLENVEIDGFEKGIVGEDTAITGRDVRFRGVGTAIEGANVDLDIDDLDIR